MAFGTVVLFSLLTFLLLLPAVSFLRLLRARLLGLGLIVFDISLVFSRDHLILDVRLRYLTYMDLSYLALMFGGLTA
jgi:hypothetical protein